jgi:nicotinamidase-related amidase
VALPTVQAIRDGYDVYVAEDCCGDVNQFSHDKAMKRATVMLEWQRDFPEYVVPGNPHLVGEGR